MLSTVVTVILSTSLLNLFILPNWNIAHFDPHLHKSSLQASSNYDFIPYYNEFYF